MSILSVAMIVKNEEQFIEKVIRNIQPIADEIVITDTGSTDRTPDLIKRFKVRLFHFRWNGDESSARNFTISKCKSDWILFIDADKFIDTKGYAKIRKIIRDDRYVAYRIRIKCHIDSSVSLEKILKGYAAGKYAILHDVIRIFKKGEGIRYCRSIYTTLADSLRGRADKIGNSGVIFHHLDILRNQPKKIEKLEWYKHDVFDNLRKHPGDPEVNYVVAHYYRLHGEFNKAIRYYQKTLEIKPDDVKARLSLGLSYVALGEEGRGIKLIKSSRNRKRAFPWEREACLNTAYRIIAVRALEQKRGV